MRALPVMRSSIFFMLMLQRASASTIFCSRAEEHGRLHFARTARALRDLVKPVRRAWARGWIFGQNASRAAQAKCSLAGLTIRDLTCALRLCEQGVLFEPRAHARLFGLTREKLSKLVDNSWIRWFANSLPWAHGPSRAASSMLP